jgi:hypothetical protein
MKGGRLSSFDLTSISKFYHCEKEKVIRLVVDSWFFTKVSVGFNESADHSKA